MHTEYDGADYVTVQVGGVEQARRVYDYDDANRLETLSETGDVTRTVTYAHDANGNRLSRVDSAAGGERTLYRYTALDQLTEVLHGAPGAEVSRGQYEYDAAGRRVRQRGTSRGDVETVYDGLSTLDEHDISGGGAGTTLAHYHYALGLARLDEGGGETRYYHLDGRGNTGALTAGSGGADTPGDVLTSYRLDPFGAVRSGTDPVNRQVYTGHETDTETGLIYMNARHYDPETGRFVTQDSWMGTGGDPGTQNRYAYALGNPATYWDPTGHESEQLPGGCNSGAEKCGQAAAEAQRGGIPFPEDSSVIQLGRPQSSASAPAPSTQTARPAPPTPRGTFSVISGGITPAMAYNALHAWTQQSLQRTQQRHAEINERIDDSTRVTNWLGQRHDYTPGIGYADHQGWDPNQQPIDTSAVPTMGPLDVMGVYMWESAPTSLELQFYEGLNMLFLVGDQVLGPEFGSAKRNYERLSDIYTFLALFEDRPEALLQAIMGAPQAFADRYLGGDSETVGSIVASLYQTLGSLAWSAAGTAVGAMIVKRGVSIVDEAADGASTLARGGRIFDSLGDGPPGPGGARVGGGMDAPGGGPSLGSGLGERGRQILAYARDVEQQTGRALHPQQRRLLAQNLRENSYSRLTPAETRRSRRVFDRRRDQVIADWEANTGQSWPRYAEDVVNPETGQIIIERGTRYDAHHLIENSYGGPHEWWNVHPAANPTQHQGGIHRAGAPIRELQP